MDYTRWFSDPKMKQEFLDRFPELASTYGGGGLEGLDGMPATDDAVNAVESMTEGTWQSDDPGLEAIIERFTRPVQLVQDNTFAPPADGLPNSEELQKRLASAKHALEVAIPSIGRINLENHRKAFAGTGWMVAPDVVATNRHVAEEFARKTDSGFEFRPNFLGPPVKAKMDWRREHQRPAESVFKVRKVLWIEPDPSFDLALLEIVGTGEADEPQPSALPLATETELNASGGNPWVAVIGYPARDSRNREDDQQRIFDGIYNVKRLAPGQITAIRPDGLVTHDATTLGGNSGSALVDLHSGKTLALHFGGNEGRANFAVQAPRLAAILREHVN